MAFDRFMIAPLNSGLTTNVKPWLIPDDAWAGLKNSYVFRGRVRKRFGGTLMGTNGGFSSRLRIGIGTTSAVTGNFSATVPGDIFKVGQMFSIGSTVFTVVVTGTPGTMLTTGTATGTYDTTTGAVVITGGGTNPLVTVYFYPAEPVQGLTIYQDGPVNNSPTYAFDTQFAYLFSSGAWNRSGSGSNPIWHGDSTNFYWATTARSTVDSDYALYVTNFQVTNPDGVIVATDDPMWYTADGSTWNTFTPKFLTAGAGSFVQTCRIIVQFKDRLLLLNTIETDSADANNVSYPNRVRWSQIGNPLGTTAYLEKGQTGYSGGGLADASTSEAIISAEFIKDRLIVYFERSTWELAFTGNEIAPFLWQKINTELGSESTFSTVPFDKQVLTIGNTGVHACNGANVERIDTSIPDTVFEIFDKNTGVQRVVGIRDYFVEMVYWTFPSTNQETAEIYPTQILTYNYKNGGWALNDDCITFFGYFEQQNAVTWATSQDTWEEADFEWGSGISSQQFRQVIAGNQQGYVFIVDPDRSRNAPVMQVTNAVTSGVGTLLTIVDHTLQNGEFIALEDMQGTNLFGNYEIAFVTTSTVYINVALVGTYIGGGTATRVSRIQMLSKQWNPYDKKGLDVYLARIDFLVDNDDVGEITVDYFPSTSGFSMLNAGMGTDSIMGTGVLELHPYDLTLYPFEAFQERLWHQVYFQTSGECIQIYINWTQEQMASQDLTWSDFQLHSMILHTQPTSSRLQ